MSPYSIPKEISKRRRLALEQFYRCHYCDRLCELVDGEDWQYSYTFTIEHVIPRGRGGKNSIENNVGSCFRCNNLRNNIEGCLLGKGQNWPDVPRELFLKLLPVDIFLWSMYPDGVSILNNVIESL